MNWFGKLRRKRVQKQWVIADFVFTWSGWRVSINRLMRLEDAASQVYDRVRFEPCGKYARTLSSDGPVPYLGRVILQDKTTEAFTGGRRVPNTTNIPTDRLFVRRVDMRRCIKWAVEIENILKAPETPQQEKERAVYIAFSAEMDRCVEWSDERIDGYLNLLAKHRGDRSIIQFGIEALELEKSKRKPVAPSPGPFKPITEQPHVLPN